MPRKVPAGVEDSWTDDLPHCELSGEGHSVNQIYRRTGHPVCEHYDEDAYFHLKSDGIQLYGIFDGHDGKSVSDYAAQKMPAELLLGQIAQSSSDDEVREAIKLAFQSVENGFMSSLDEVLATRHNLLQHISGQGGQGDTAYETLRQNPETMQRISVLNHRISSGSSGAICLVVQNRLFVANVGDTRILLCKTDATGDHRVLQLSADHVIENEDEALRLSQLGLTITALEHFNHTTRCLGDHTRKGAYKDFELISSAIAEPVIADPEIKGPILIDDACRFLIIMSSGTYKTYMEATDKCPDEVNSDIASMVGSAFLTQASISGVAQSVIDHIARLHHDAYLEFQKEEPQTTNDVAMSTSVTAGAANTFGHSSSDTHCDAPPGTKGDLPPNHPARSVSTPNSAMMSPPPSMKTTTACQKREDMTLIIRNFNFQHPYAASLTKTNSPQQIIHGTSSPVAKQNKFDIPGSAQEDTLDRMKVDNSFISATSTAHSTLIEPPPNPIPLNENGRVVPYVDFSCYFEEVEKLRLRISEKERNCS